MIEIVASHQLYFYQLFRDALGVGKQVSLAQVEEVLSVNDVAPVDVGAADVGELLGALGAFMKVTTFKRGRVVATVLRNDEMDDALSKAAEAPATKARPKGKPWKAKGTKAIVPAKPRPAPQRVAEEGPGSGSAPEAAEREHAVERGAQSRDDVRADALAAGDGTSVAGGSPAPADDAMQVASTPQEAPASASLQVPIDNDGVFALDDRADGAPDGAGDAQDAPHDDARQDERPAKDATTDLAGDEGRAGAEPSIMLTITYDPKTDERDVPDASEARVAPVRERPARQARRRGKMASYEPTEPSPTPALGLPQRFSHDVYCADKALLALVEALPPETDYLAALDAAWDARVAAAEPDPHRPIAFAVFADDVPVATATIRRRRPTPSGRRWELAEVVPIAHDA